ncbi:MAG: EamA family transporter [bacterium]
MNSETILLTVLSLFGWGVGAFFSKMATNRIGESSVFWDLIGYFPLVIIYTLVAFKAKDILGSDRGGIMYGLIAGLTGAIGLISFYLLVSKRDAGVATSVTAMYPALTAILSFIFLGEKITLLKAVGIVLATGAVFLLAI